MVTGVLIAESIPPPASLDAVALTVHTRERVRRDNISPEQRAAGFPADWTLLCFEVGDDDAPRLADALAGMLGDFGRYADFHTADESFVVYAGRVFRYPKGDADGRAEARAHGRARACPSRSSTGPDHGARRSADRLALTTPRATRQIDFP